MIGSVGEDCQLVDSGELCTRPYKGLDSRQV